MQSDSQMEISPLEVARRAAGVPVQALSLETGIPRSTLQRRLDHPETASLAEVSAIAAATGADAVGLVSAVLSGQRVAVPRAA